jgi:nucleoside 2-deoxyribosyltransferase
VAVLAKTMGLGVYWYKPQPGEGAGATFNRDAAMVRRADYVLAFFDEDHAMEGGTAHVVDAALNAMVPVYAWTLDPAGRLARLGEWTFDEMQAQAESDLLE